MRAVLLVIAVGATAHGEPIKSVLATGGTWLPAQWSNTFRNGGAEVDIEQDVGSVGRIGAGAQLLAYQMVDDECHGYSGQLAAAFGSLTWRDPEAELVHFFIGLRAGARVLREVPSCYPKDPIRHEFAPYAGLGLGLDIGRGSTRVRVQLVYAMPIEVAAAVGVAF
jgi:hypothetical protein